jgi:vitamin B12 transporter
MSTLSNHLLHQNDSHANTTGMLPDHARLGHARLAIALRRGLLLGLLAVAGSPALAQASSAQSASAQSSSPGGPSAHDLDTVVVVGHNLEETLPQELARYGHAVETITAERIEAAGYIDVSSALQYEVPGLYVSPGSGAYDYVDVSLQGSRTGDVLWLIDGVRINNRIFNSTSPDTLPASAVERIEVLKGGESLFYGTQAVAGAINIVTRAYTDTPGGQVGLGYDSNDGTRIHVSGHGQVGRHRFLGYASRDAGDGYRQFDHYEPSATDRDRSYTVSNVGLKYGNDLTDKLKLDLFYHHTEALLDNNAPSRTRRSYNDRDEDVASLRLAYAASSRVQYFLKAYLHDWDTTYANIQNRPLTGEELVIYPPGTYWGFRDYGVNGLARIAPGGRFEYHVGYDYQNYRARDDVFPIAGDTETVNAVFGHVRSAPGAFGRLATAAGVRYNRGSGGKDATVWNLSGRFDVSPALYIEGLASTAFLLPSAEQLYYVGYPPDDYVGNPLLQPEESVNLNLSLGGRVGTGAQAWGWKLTGFARDIDHLIDIGYDDPDYPNGRYGNVAGKVTVRGAEAAVVAPLGQDLRLEGSYTWTRSRDEGSDLQRQRTPVRFAKAKLEYAPDAPFGASVAVHWTGDVYQTVAGYGRRNYGGQAVTDLAAHAWLDAARRHRINLRLENAFDRDYATRLSRTNLDSGTGFALVRRLGVPRTLHVNYSYTF